MSKQLAKIANDVPIEWDFNGTTLKFRKIKLSDYAAVWEWARFTLIKEYNAALDDLDPTEKLQMRKSNWRPAEYEISALTDNVRGTLYLIHRAASKYQPDMTMEEVGDLVDVLDIAPLYDTLRGIAGGEGEVLPPEPAEEPTQTTQ